MTERFIIDDCGTLIDMVTRNTYDYVSDVAPLLNALAEENEQLKKENNDYLQDLDLLMEENAQLQLRNYRQAETIGELYNLIEKEDWKALQQIIQDFKDCEEQLQKEWARYDR